MAKNMAENKARKKNKNFDIYMMELHETLKIGLLTITRVPGGWLYDGVFVPFENEFQTKEYRKNVP